ncbi:MAG TPA: amidohydrolase [Tissierellia bacterium]|nr:amidohydrolase [Tissierellia bacterium]
MLSTIERAFASDVTLDWLIEIRREFHSQPEVSGQEHKTMRRIVNLLDSWGVEHISPVAETGVVAIIRGKRPGKTIGLRADIDALPIQEMNDDISYASKNPGVMHACGHDAHTTVLLGVIKLLRALDGDFAGNLKFFFQPDEEDRGGAERMIQEGCLEDPHVDAVIGLHVTPDYPSGNVAFKYGKMYASSDMTKLIVSGQSAHGASPDRGVDALMITAQILTAAQSIVSRNVSPLDSAVVTFGKIQGGRVRNQIAEEVVVEGIIRTLDPQMRIQVRERLTSICENIAEAMGGHAQLQVTESYGSLINNDAITDVVVNNARTMLGEDAVIIKDKAQMGTEDFAYFAKARPACFFHLGCGFEDRNSPPTHSSCFDINETCLEVGVKLQAYNALMLLSSLD